MYQQVFESSVVCKSLKIGIILPLFKGKGAKANNKDNYKGITLFSTLCKIYEMILLNRLEKFAIDNEYFSELQFGFGEGVGCIESSFTTLETINHMLEWGSKVLGCLHQLATDVPFIACVINLPCTFNRYLDMSSLQFCFMIWIVVF